MRATLATFATRGLLPALVLATVALSAEAQPTVVEAESVAPADGDVENKQKLPCGCAKPRLIRRGKEIDLSHGASLGAWVDLGPAQRLDEDGRKVEDTTARVFPFAQDFFARGERSEVDDGPQVARTWADELLGHEGFAAGRTHQASRHRLLALGLGAPQADPFFLGMLRAKEKVPRDLVRVTPGDPAATEEELAAQRAVVQLNQLWLDQYDVIDRAACGPAVPTVRVLWEEREDSPPVAGFWVEVRLH